MDKTTAILADRLYEDGTLKLEDVEVTLPEISAQTFETRAMGPVNVSLPGLFESMEMGIKATGATKEYASISKFGTHNFIVTAAQQKVSADGSITPKQFKAEIRGICKKIGQIGVIPGEAAEPESTYEVTRYKAYADGQVLWEIDKLNGKCIVDGVDYGGQIANLLSP